MNLNIILLSYLFFSLLLNFGNPADPEYNVDNIPPELTNDAVAVVRSNSETFEIKSVNKALLTVKRAVTIMDKNGDRFADLILSYDNFRRINNIKATIYDQKGDRIEKVKSSDIEDYSSFSGYSIYEDSRYKSYEPQVKDYPFTIEYEYEIEYNGLLNYRTWYPVYAYDVSVENSVFTFIIPLEMSFRYEERNLSADSEIEDTEKQRIYRWKINNFPAIESEAHSPYFSDICPSVVTVPNEFEIDGYKGDMNSWEQFGLWAYTLLDGRDELPLETIDMIKELTAGLTDKKEITRQIYEYVQSKTRYVSIQEGIGGWQPFSAIEVDKNGYGDCKALSNYTMALLKSVGIKSHYTKVRAGQDAPNMNKELVSNQSNHVILCVPFDSDTTWLECTSQTNPFGYIGNFTDDRDVLLVSDEGGKVVHTKAYKREENYQYRKAQVSLDESGNGRAEISTKYSGLQYDNVSGQLLEPYEEKEKWLYRNIDITNFNILNFSYSEQRKNVPVATQDIEIKLTNYASIMGKRMFIPLNLMNKTTYIPPKVKERKTDVVINFPFVDIDTVEYQLPSGYNIESKPENSTITSEFGEYKAEFTYTDEKVTYVRTRKMDKGRFPPGSYEKLINFYKKTVKADKAELVLVKNQKSS